MVDPASKLGEALEALQAGDPESAGRRLAAELDGVSANARASAAIGVALLQLGQFPEAIRALEQAHYLEPGNAQILFDYGAALEAAGRDTEARLRFRAVLRLDPEHREARLRLGGSPSNEAPHALVEAEQPAATPAEASHARPTPAPAVVRRSSTSPLPTGSPTAPAAVPARRTSPVPSRRTPLAELPSREENWEPEPLPGFWELARAVSQLWANQPLLWLALLAIPNVLAVLVPLDAEATLVDVWVWLAALGLGAAPALLCMTGQWMSGSPFRMDRREAGAHLLRGVLLALPYILVTLGPFCALLAMRSRFSVLVLVATGLVVTAPFHALAAPALVLAVTKGASPAAALRRAVQLAGRRTWMHLGLMLALGGLAGAFLFLYGWSFAVTLRAGGGFVKQLLQVAGLAGAESIWAALIAVCGLDALAMSGLTQEVTEAEPLENAAPDAPSA